MRKAICVIPALLFLFLSLPSAKVAAHDPEANGKWLIIGTTVLGCGDSGNYCYYNIPVKEDP
jgi:hypothetical protein